MKRIPVMQRFIPFRILYPLFILLIALGSSVFSQETLLWNDDFEDGDSDGWLFYDDATGSSNWFVEGGYLIQTSNIGSSGLGTHAVAGLATWDNYTVSANVVSTDDDYIGVLFRYQNAGNYYRMTLSSQAGRIRLEKRQDGILQTLQQITMMWPLCTYNITIDVQNDTISVYLNQVQYFELIDASFGSGRVGFATINNNGSFFDDISVYDRLEVEPPDQSLVINRGPYLQNVLGDSATVMWRTNQYTNSIVEYGLSTTETELVGSTTPKKNHELVLRDLLRGQEYVYRVFSNNQVSDWAQFISARLPQDPFSFALLGDNRTNFLRHGEISAAISEETPDFLINVGDVVQYGLRADWDTEFFNPMADLIKNMPIYVSIGNHEKESSYFSEYFAFPDPDHEHYYSFEYGNTFFIFIDNNIAAYPSSNYPAIHEESDQYSWLEEQLGSAEAQNAEWLFVLGHVPIYSVSTNNNYDQNRDFILPLLLDYEVDIYFAGHIHDYERGFSEGLHHIISGGAGGPLSHRVRDIPEITEQVSNYHYCMIEVNDSVLGFQIKDKDQNLLDQFVISKDPDSISDKDPIHPQQLTLHNYPNPFNASTMIQFTLPLEGEYSLKIYDISGRLVTTLAEGFARAGTYWLHWDGDDANGRLVPSGVYTCQIVTESGSSQIKLSYLK
ncbi:MAG: metallophosphoesterase [Candidatus Marinimicrobia bacterium]|nr:metallophosphoesterase [Candidatus Neomarinimicrobiota bacterium]